MSIVGEAQITKSVFFFAKNIFVQNYFFNIFFRVLEKVAQYRKVSNIIVFLLITQVTNKVDRKKSFREIMSICVSGDLGVLE